MKTSIVIPMYGHWDLVHPLLMQLWSHSLQRHSELEIVLVDDCSPDPNAYSGGIKWWQAGLLEGRFRYFRNKENRGFSHTCNTGAKIAIKNGAEIVIFLSTDVTVMGDIAGDVETLVNLDKNIVVGGTILCNDTGWNNLPNCGPVPYPEGWMLACHVDVWGQLGGFDGNFAPYDYEDVDLGTQCWWQGIKLVSAPTKLRHAGGKSISVVNPNRVLITQKNGIYWRSKWADKAEELKHRIYG